MGGRCIRIAGNELCSEERSAVQTYCCLSFEVVLDGRTDDPACVSNDGLMFVFQQS